jgi:hypothetical protein
MTTFKTLVNNLSTTLGAHYTAGSGTMTVASGTGASFGTVSASAPVRFTVVTSGTYGTNDEIFTIYQATGINGDVLSGVSAIEGTTDQNYSTGDVVEARPTQGSYADIHSAINAIENAPYSVDTTVVHLAGAETITGAKTFANKLTLAAAPDPVAPGAGDVWNGSSQGVLSFVSSGMVARAGGIVWQGLGAGTAVANTTLQQSVLSGIGTTRGTLTIPTNSLLPGKILTIDVYGKYSSTSSKPTITFVILLGGVVIAKTSAVVVPVANTNSMWYVTCPSGFQVQAIGTSGKVLGRAVVVGNGSTAFTSYATQPGPPGIGVATINTTVPLTFDVQVQWSMASPSNSIQFLGGTLSIGG